MKDIYLLADKFLQAVETVEPTQVKVAAGRKNRKQLERDLAYAKDYYARHRLSLDGHERAFKDLNSIMDRERKEVERAKADINRGYDVLKNMDLYDVQEVRFMNDDVGYVRKGRLFKLDETNNLIPFRRKRPEDEMELGPEDSEIEEDPEADDLLSALM